MNVLIALQDLFYKKTQYSIAQDISIASIKYLHLVSLHIESKDISSLIKNAHPDARIIVAEKKRGTDFRKMYLLGDNGPVKRLEKEVDK